MFNTVIPLDFNCYVYISVVSFIEIFILQKYDPDVFITVQALKPGSHFVSILLHLFVDLIKLMDNGQSFI